ncbi:MAG: hypothetical protein GY790_03840 [Bacteroidetes bacterium]|nr:hypothetical protein [Bacteroidota bacterium]
MKTTIGFAIFLTLFTFNALYSQTSNGGFSYQAIARNLEGAPLADVNLTIRVSILVENQGGELIWQEEHDVQTSKLGLFTLQVGDPKAVNQTGSADSFDQIDWSAHGYFLNVWVKSDGAFTDMGGSPIQTVPVAQYATSAKSARTSFSVQPRAGALPGEALFEVIRSDGQPVFAVYEDMVWVYVDTLEKKGVRGGFAVGGYSRKSKGVTEEYMRVTPDSVRIYIDDEPSKGMRGGFAVGGYSRKTKGSNDLYFNLSPNAVEETILDKSQILYYPSKDAFFAGTIHVGSADSVGFNSTSLGYKSVAMGQYSQGFGYKSMALGSFSTAIGREAVAMENSFALGNTTKALGNDSYAFGSGAHASGDRSYAFGSVGIDTLGNPTGVPTTASGAYSIAFGMGAQALNSGAMSLGPSSTADGFQSVAIGSGTSASGSYATGIGYRSHADGYKSIAIGAHYSYPLYIPDFPIFNKKGGQDEITKGSTAPIIPTPIINPPIYIYKPRYITAYNEAVGDYSISLGNGNHSNNGGFALGTYNKAYNQGSVALGVSNIARRAYSFAAGYNNDAVGYYSMAIGDNVTSQAMNALVIGKYNVVMGDTADWVATDPLFQIGNGTSSSTRHDAFKVDKNGRVTIYPVNAYNGTSILSEYNIDYGSSSGYGLLSRVSRGKAGVTYYSGYFYDTGTEGSYSGLYADLRSGAAIDVAEYIYDTHGNTEPGDVLVADPGKDESVIRSQQAYQTSVLGVVSTKPHLVMGMDLVVDEETGEPIEGVSATRLALTGRVPVKFTGENGSVQPGDLLTTSSTPGHAMKWSLLDVNEAKDFDELKSMLAENERRRNAVIGKAVSSSDSETGIVMVLISLQ